MSSSTTRLDKIRRKVVHLLDQALREFIGPRFAKYATAVLIAISLGLIYVGHIITSILGVLMLFCWCLFLVALVLSNQSTLNEKQTKDFFDLYYTDPLTRIYGRPQDLEKANLAQKLKRIADALEQVPNAAAELRKKFPGDEALVQAWRTEIRNWAEDNIYNPKTRKVEDKKKS